MPCTRTLLALASLIALVGCDASSPILLVELRTDFVPLAEFTEVEVARESLRGDLVQTHRLGRDQDFLTGSRVAEIQGLTPGTHTLRVRLLREDGRRLAQQLVLVEVGSDSRSVTVLLTRNCAGVRCEAEGASQCIDARCVDPSCTPENPDACGDARCTEDADCTELASECADAVCDEGVCLASPIDGACDSSAYCAAENGCQPLPWAPDAGLEDAGGFDAGSADAGPMDAGSLDGGPVDAGQLDAGPPRDGGPCMCLGDPRAECGTRPFEGFCYFTLPGCDVVTPCPENYECGVLDRCICQDAALCGIQCAADVDCPDEFICDDVDSVCRHALPCIDASDCAGSEVCGKDHRCIPPGPLADGVACSDDEECQSGVCDSFCLALCNRNGECSGGLVCESAGTDYSVSVCRLPSSGCESCAPDQFCDDGDCEVACSVSSDCPAAQDCQIDNRNVSRCRPSIGCAPDELSTRSGGLCVAHEGCWLESDRCSSGFTCTEGLFTRIASTASFCARPAPS